MNMHPAIKPPIWPMYAITQEPRGRQLLIRIQTRYKGRLMDVQQTLSEHTLGFNQQQLDSVVEYTRAGLLRKLSLHIARNQAADLDRLTSS